MDPEDNIGDDIRAAMEEVPDRVDDTPEDIPALPSANEPAAGAPTTPAAEPATGGERDASGRFTPRQAAPAVVDPLAPAVPPVGQPAQARAPVSWRPEAREEWNKLPPLAQQEIARRERDITETLRTTADARQLQQQFQQISQPYMQFIQAENSTPIQAFQNLMQTAATLRVGSAGQKAQLVTEMVMQHGVDLAMLDQMLSARMSGQQAPQVDNGLMRVLDQRLQPMMEFMNRQQAQQSQQAQELNNGLQNELVDFMADPANEFAGDVAADMADIMDLATARGQKINLQQAYNKATMLHPTISGIVQRRQEATAPRSSGAVLRAKRAAASIPNNGAPSRDGEGDDGDDIRSAITASIRSSTRRV